MHIVVRCTDCRDGRGRPKIWRHSCDDCCTDQIARHTADHPEHRLEMSNTLLDEPPQRASRATQQLIGRRTGW